MPPEDSRTTALRILDEYQRTETYLNLLLSSRLAGSDLERRDRALVTELVQGTVRMKLALDSAVGSFSRRPLEELDDAVLWALRLGVYQLLFTGAPDYAALDATASATAAVVGQYAVGYVNGVLRAFSRSDRSIGYPEAEADPAGYLQMRYSHPRWVVEMWIRELGFEQAEAVCAADNVEPRLSLRTNLNRTSRDELAARLIAREIEVETGDITPECLLVKRSGPLADLPEHQQGLFAVQDQASQLVGHQVSPAPGMRVLDACAAPGGKANHLAELMRNEGDVLAVDVSEERLRYVSESAGRLGNTALRTLTLDATGLKESEEGLFDRVLLDAPCTGLGTLARRPDARWRKHPRDVEDLAGLQSRLMASAAEVVAPAGLLVYSTCTISQRENEGVVNSFLAAHQRFTAEAVTIRDSRIAPYLRLLPEPGVCDGMFMAVLRRSA